MIAKLPPVALKLLLALLSPLIFVLLLELGLRISPWSDQLGPQRYHGGLVDHAHFWNPDSMLNLDAEVLMPGGEFRGRSYADKKPRGVYRVVTLGGSFTYGWPYNERPEVAYPAVMERALNDGGDLPLKVEVINGGVGGYTSFQGLYYFKKRLVKFQPDLITICFGANDAAANDSIGVHMSDREYYEHLATLQQRKGMMKVKKVLDNLRVYALVEKALYKVRKAAHKEGQRVPPEDFKRNLREFVQLARGHGFKILLIPEPSRVYATLEEQLEVNPYTQAMGEAAREHPELIKIVDFITPLAGRDKDATFYDEMHLTVEANDFAGKLLAEGVRKSGWLKSGE